MRKYLFMLCSGMLLFAAVVGANESGPPDEIAFQAIEETVAVAVLLPETSPEASRPAPPAPDEEKKKEWYDMIKWYGDFRYRWETIDEGDKDTRHRNRIRARFGMKTELLESFMVNFRLATGSGDPVSTNQTLGGGYSSKQINLDLAYFDWHPGQAKGLHMVAGKMLNAFYTPIKTELIWDGDLTPGGVAGKFDREISPGAELFGAVSAYWVDERKNDPSALMYGFQGGAKFKVPDSKVYFRAGVTFYYYTNLQGYPILFDPEDPFGNSVVLDEETGELLYAYDYHLLEIFGDVGFAVSSVPIAFLFDYVQNLAPGVEQGKGWLVGFAVGKTKKPGNVKFYYNYRDLEADAVFGLATDSDFAGGGTNAKGSEVGFGVQITKYVTGALSYFNNRLRPDDENTKFHRFMADIQVKF